MSRFSTRFSAITLSLIGALTLGMAGVVTAAGPDAVPVKKVRVVPGDVSSSLKPTAFSNQLADQSVVKKRTIPALDIGAIAAEDDQNAQLGLPPRYAIPHPVLITPSNSGLWETLADGRMVWRMRIASPGALHINLGFIRYNMPVGGTLFLYSADGRDVMRPFTHNDNADHNELWTPPIRGDELIIEVTLPAAEVPNLQLELGSVNIGYRRFMDIVDPNEIAPRSGSCNVDVVCPVGDPWDLDIPSVAVISTGGSTFCTGFMVNDVPQDLTPYFMTANHCGVNSGNAASLVTFWNYQNSVCRGEPGGGGVGDGTLTQFNTGSTFRAGNAASDFTIVQLSSSPNPAWNVSFAGWDNDLGNFPPSGACIHHPSTDEKRITFYDVAVRPDRPTHSSSWGCSAFPGPGDGSHISAYWSLGVTEPGSSGSPLFDNNHRVIGQLHGGPSSCSQTGDGLSDCYGRIAVSWNGGGTPSTRLKDWLDPGNTGAINVNTIPGGGIATTPSGVVISEGVVGGPFTNPSTVYTLTNHGPSSADYSVSIVGGGTAPLLLDGGAGPVGGTLAGSGGSTTVTVSLDASANSMSAGIYSTTVLIQDTTNSINTNRTHNLEIGQTGFNTTPTDGLTSGGPVGGPFSGTQVYNVISTKSTPVSVEISSNQPWISINGGAGPVTVNLNSLGADANVSIGFSAAANALSAGLYNGTVTFTNLNGGSGGTTRPVQLDVGRFTYAATGLPLPITDNNTTTSTITVGDGYCIGDVNVEVNITHTYIGDLIIELTSPQNTVVRLHNRTGGGTDNLSRLYDQGVTNPDGPGSLDDFGGEIVTGVWTLTVSDNAGQDIGTLDSWTLKIASSGAVCPPVASNVSANVADSITTPIVLNGVSSQTPTPDYIVLSLPANGSLTDPNGGLITSVPHTLAALGKIVNFQPAAYYTGPASFTYKVNDGQDSNVATVSINVGGEQVIHDFPLNSNPGWTTMGQWAYGVPSGGCTSGRNDPTSGYTGSNVYGYNLAGCYPDNLSPIQYLTTAALNCSGVSSTTLKFRRWLGVESATYDHANVEVSSNGSTWAPVWSHVATSALNEQSWSQQTFSIGGTADNQATVYVRWGMGTTDGSVVYQGWNIDDIQITGLIPPKLGDIDNDGDCDDDDTDAFIKVLIGVDTNELHVSRSDLNVNSKSDGSDVPGFTAARLAP
jgi:subtilisin-like proprotein convertase family protein